MKISLNTFFIYTITLCTLLLLATCSNDNQNPKTFQNITSFSGTLESLNGPEDEINHIKNFPKAYYQVYNVDNLGFFYLDNRVDIIKNELRAGHQWEKNIVELMALYIRPGSTAIDIGAHIGTHTLSMSKLVGSEGKVVAFEPQTKLYSELVMNLLLNGCHNTIAYRCALGDTLNTIEMNRPIPDNEGGTAIGKGGDKAEMITLDSLNLKNVSFIKIDVENFEYEVLNGAEQTIKQNLPYMIIEIMGNIYEPIPNRDELVQKTFSKLKELGYSFSFIQGSWSDWLAIPPQAQSISQPKICLNMIVKNERDVITRCLSSLLPFIDYWVIVDTGSTDGTQQTIKTYMQEHNIKGELYERPWINFEHNRNEARELAKDKGDYLFFIDADEYLVYPSDFKLPPLNKDYYYIPISHSGAQYPRIQLVNNNLSWKWVGVLHEVLVPSPSYSFDTLANISNIYTTDGARSKDPQKYQKDAQVLETALAEDPNNSRYVFYLAQSYRDAKDYPKALTTYERRSKMGGWNEEVFYSLLQIALLQETLKMPSDVVVASYSRAYQYRTSRVEPLYYMAKYFRDNNNFKSGYLVAQIAQTLPVSQDLLFVEKWMYDYGIALELSICAYWIGKYEECQQISLDLLKRKDLPANVRTCVENNLGFANAKLLDQIALSIAVPDDPKSTPQE